jgi:hypothetical protein
MGITYLNNVRHEAISHFRNKKREYLKDQINELAMNSKNKNFRDLYRGINEFRVATNQHGTYTRMRMVICLQIPTPL